MIIEGHGDPKPGHVCDTPLVNLHNVGTFWSCPVCFKWWKLVFIEAMATEDFNVRAQRKWVRIYWFNFLDRKKIKADQESQERTKTFKEYRYETTNVTSKLDEDLEKLRETTEQVRAETAMMKLLIEESKSKRTEYLQMILDDSIQGTWTFSDGEVVTGDGEFDTCVGLCFDDASGKLMAMAPELARRVIELESKS